MSKVLRNVKSIEIFGLPVAGSVLAAMVVFVYQWMWFGSVFKIRWNILIGLPEDQLVIPQIWWAVAFGFVIAQMFGLGHALRRAGWPAFRGTVSELSIVSSLLALPITAFPLLYHPDHSWERFAYEAGGFVSAWIIGGLIVRSMKDTGAEVAPTAAAGAERALAGER